MNKHFRTEFAESIFNNKYRHEGAETWDKLSDTLMKDVCGGVLTKNEISELTEIHTQMKFIAGGRYLYYAGRSNKFFNNCFLFRSLEDSREDWADLSWKVESSLMTGGGIGNDYSIYRPEGTEINGTGGISSGPIPKMEITNEQGRRIMQGGSRRSALYGSLLWTHKDAPKLLYAKDWHKMFIPGTKISYAQAKEADFNFPAPLDMTNISLNYDNSFLKQIHGDDAERIYRLREKNVNVELSKIPSTFIKNIRQALQSGEPGFSFNFYDKVNETLRNACTEVSSEDDSDVCNLGSVNMSRIDTIEEFRQVVRLGIYFLLCGTLKAKLPFEKIYHVREKNRRLGLGLMGVHEWLLKRGYHYEVVDELKQWLQVYKDESDSAAFYLADKLGISRPIARRAIAPTGTIGILSGTTTSSEPLLAVGYMRRYLKNGKEWHYQYVVDGTAQILINDYGLDPNSIETALDLASDYERRIAFQADIQDYVDMCISSTINLPSYGTDLNNEDTVNDFAVTLAKYAHRLRGFTCYPDGSRGGQPITPVPYDMAVANQGIEHQEFLDVCDLTKGGICGS